MGSTARPTPDGWLTLKDAGERLGVSRQRIHQLLNEGQLPSSRRDDDHPLWRWLIAESDIDALLAGAS